MVSATDSAKRVEELESRLRRAEAENSILEKVDAARDAELADVKAAYEKQAVLLEAQIGPFSSDAGGVDGTLYSKIQTFLPHNAAKLTGHPMALLGASYQAFVDQPKLSLLKQVESQLQQLCNDNGEVNAALLNTQTGLKEANATIANQRSVLLSYIRVCACACLFVVFI